MNERLNFIELAKSKWMQPVQAEQPEEPPTSTEGEAGGDMEGEEWYELSSGMEE